MHYFGNGRRLCAVLWENMHREGAPKLSVQSVSFSGLRSIFEETFKHTVHGPHLAAGSPVSKTDLSKSPALTRIPTMSLAACGVPSGLGHNITCCATPSRSSMAKSKRGK